MNVFRLRLAGSLPKLDQREDENAFDKDEDGGTGPDENLEKKRDIPIDVRPLVEDGLGLILPTGSKKGGQGDRQRDRTRFAGARPAQAGEKRHAISLYRAF